MVTTQSDESRSLLIEVARLYYEQQLTQTEIGRHIDMSRSTVSRMLQEARDMGIVTITIAYDVVRNYKLEYALTDTFGLRDVRVIESFDRSPDVIRRGMGQLAAHLLEDRVSDDTTLGISYGRTIAMTIDQVRPSPRTNVTIVPVIGAVGSDNPVIEGIDLTRQLAMKFGARYRYLHAPLLVEDRRTADLFRQEPTVNDVLNLGKTSDIVIMGIGSLHASSSSIIWNGYINRKELDWLKNKGVVGHMCAQFFDIKGEILDIDINHKSISIGLSTLKSIDNVIAIAGTTDKASAILGALNGGYIDILVTDDNAARLILEHYSNS